MGYATTAGPTQMLKSYADSSDFKEQASLRLSQDQAHSEAIAGEKALVRSITTMWPALAQKILWLLAHPKHTLLLGSADSSVGALITVPTTRMLVSTVVLLHQLNNHPAHHQSATFVCGRLWVVITQSHVRVPTLVILVATIANTTIAAPWFLSRESVPVL